MTNTRPATIPVRREPASTVRLTVPGRLSSAPKSCGDRHATLASGKPVTAATVATARERAERSLERAKAAHLSAAKHHRDAESAHLRAAAAHEQAALGADDLHGSAHQDAAEQHREAAEAHEAAAALQFDEYLAAGKVRPTPLPPSAAERR